jgi:hypothetical protein
MYLDREKAISEMFDDAAFNVDRPTIRIKKTVYDWQQEIAVSHRRLKDSGQVQRFVSRVTGQIQDKSTTSGRVNTAPRDSTPAAAIPATAASTSGLSRKDNC